MEEPVAERISDGNLNPFSSVETPQQTIKPINSRITDPDGREYERGNYRKKVKETSDREKKPPKMTRPSYVPYIEILIDEATEQVKLFQE